MSVERLIRVEVEVAGGISEVWAAWTTPEGITSFFAPACKVELVPGGAYEIFFTPDAEPGLRGAEETRVMAIQPETMLAFDWSAPPDMPEVRRQRTHVVVRLRKIDAARTSVVLSHSGWGEGGEWDRAFEYFMVAWHDIVLPRLIHRFAEGPVDWACPPRPESNREKERRGRVTGIGGVFFKSEDPDGLRAWYRQHLGIEPQAFGGASFLWRECADPGRLGMTIWTPFVADTTYFDPSSAPYMINYRVDDLAVLMARLRASGLDVDAEIEESEYGRFGWIMDPEGRRIELWEPPA